ncbi:MAG: hypothetical protein A2150_03765 [Candidatus Muproteobacteria bacterium RBG_16_64_11]|uniref:Uncharacterized protein n=1 Tax=Candidatus Muproteobacteria bacterium RBG_16_64_11 TaxID=1817758 RepID=A0A1F6TC40_9PROT|nr:MAG: hypothetical protein A2150_03765 [Candidatus Muproteobacteria bacterium RBG_16_64_11]
MPLASRVKALLGREESAHPGLSEVAAMVYIGDVYVLREQPQPGKNDGWGENCYHCASPRHL